MSKSIRRVFPAVLIAFSLLTIRTSLVYCWSNGGYSDSPQGGGHPVTPEVPESGSEGAGSSGRHRSNLGRLTANRAFPDAIDLTGLITARSSCDSPRQPLA